VAEPPYLSGAAMLVRSSALQQVGLFDEELFLYHEDLELCLRFRLAGWHLGLCSEARVIHHYDHARSVKQLYFMERNRWLVWISYFKLPTLLLLLVPAFLAELLMLVAASLNGWLGPKLKAYGYFLQPSSWAAIGARSRKLAALRTVPDRELLRHASATIRSRSASGRGGALHGLANTLAVSGWKLLYPLIRW
jgi:GT2 family glycosyltransferase